MTATTWVTIGGLAVATAGIKASGPVIFGGRELPRLLARIIPLLAPALLAALVVTETFGGHARALIVDARAAGIVAAGIALAMRASLVVVVLSAAVTTALVRAIS
jgi:branched-subunit amino acid transport protein